MRTHYEVLGIEITAGDQQIKAAYRRAARYAHPDQGGDAEEFRRVAEAYQTLIDPARRAAYDRSYASGNGSSGEREPFVGTQRPRSSAGSDHQPARADGDASAGQAAGLPVFVPPFGSGDAQVLSLDLASRQIHGAPRKRRREIFGVQARLVREARIIELIQRQILHRYPSARLINGLTAPVGNTDIDHVVLMGYRMAVIGSMMLPEGAYRWNGSVLNHGGRSIEPPRILPAVNALSRLFPECTVSGWVIAISPGGNPYEPVLDYTSGHHPDGAGLSLVGAARLGRELGSFLTTGSSPQTVDLPLLSRLLAAMA